jgi:hypothetical protein
VLICYEKNVLLAGCWWLIAGLFCWLVADKPSEQGEYYYFIIVN